MADSVDLWDNQTYVYPELGPIYDDKGDLPEESKARREAKHPPKRFLTPRERTPVKFQWMEREASRAPLRFRERVIKQFISPENIAYLRGVFSKFVPPGQMRVFATETLEDAIYNFDRVYDILESDPLAVRGENRVASGLWQEIKRLNRAFFSDRMKFLREHASIVEKGDRKMKWGPRDWTEDEDEPYAMRMFIADSLRPPGLEHLNTPGPLYALREDQVDSERPAPGKKGKALRELFANRAGAVSAGQPAGDPGVSAEDAPWSEGNPNRTPSQAIEEYWGDGFVPSETPPTEATMLGAQEQTGAMYGELYSWGNKWVENGGTRFMRTEAVPFWQKGGREGYDYEIEETLGTAGRELDNDVRRVDMSRLRNPRGEEYRRYGARSGYIV